MLSFILIFFSYINKDFYSRRYYMSNISKYNLICKQIEIKKIDIIVNRMRKQLKSD